MNHCLYRFIVMILTLIFYYWIQLICAKRYLFKHRQTYPTWPFYFHIIIEPMFVSWSGYRILYHRILFYIDLFSSASSQRFNRCKLDKAHLVFWKSVNASMEGRQGGLCSLDLMATRRGEGVGSEASNSTPWKQSLPQQQHLSWLKCNPIFHK